MGQWENERKGFSLLRGTFPLPPCLAPGKETWRLTLCSLAPGASHAWGRREPVEAAFLRLRNSSPDACELVFTGYRCCAIYIFTASFSSSPRGFPAEFVFKPMAPKYKTKYLRLNLAPKKKTLAHNINDIQPLMISTGSNAHTSKHPLVPKA